MLFASQFSLPLALPDFPAATGFHDLALPELTADEWLSFVILAVFVALLGIEAGFVRRERRPREYRRSYSANLATLLLNDCLMSLLSVSSLWLLAERHSGWGLLGTVEDPLAKGVLSFLLLDLTLYLWHRACHGFDGLWLFHKVHHSDRVMNVTTAFRLHFMEVLLTALVKTLFIVAVGVDTEVLMANEAFSTLFVMFHHSGISFPGERQLGWLTIVPRLHRVHHSVARSEHDSNFGAVLSWWDRLFGSFRELEPAEIGLRRVPALNALQLVKFGFIWRPMFPEPLVVSGAAGTATAAAGLWPGLPQPLLQLVNLGLKPPDRPNADAWRSMVAEAAYYRAEKRGFAPGNEVLDWMEAERELRGLPSHR